MLSQLSPKAPSLQTSLGPASSSRYGKITDIAWVPLPSPIGSGTVLALASEMGSLTFVDTVQTLQQPSQKQRNSKFRGLAAASNAEVSLPEDNQQIGKYSLF